jgi:hypothetical protein
MTTKITIASVLFLTLNVTSCKDNDAEISSIKPNSNNVFASLDYDKAVAYNYDGEGEVEIIDDKGKLAPKIKKQIALTRPQVIKLTNIFCSKSTYGGDVAACFDPHFGVVFYKANRPRAYVSICLDCNYLVSSIKIPSLDQTGFSNKGAKNIYDFEKQIKLLQ